MLKYPLSTLLYLAKINIKDTIQDALKLHDNIDVRITITVKDKDGNIIKVKKQKSHSFVANFLIIIASLLANTGYNFTDISGVNNNNIYFPSTINEALSLVYNGVYNDGIVIGTGTYTPTASDYRLVTQIGNGTSSGQMVYNNISFTAPSVSGNTTTFKISQTFQNQSGASITVTEVGLQVASSQTANSVTTVLIAHDLLSSPITVANLSVLLIIYTISITT